MDRQHELANQAARDLGRAGFSRLCVEDDGLDESEVEALQTAVDDAASEAPIQRYLAENPHQLRGAFDGQCRWLKAQPRLGGRYVADFFVAWVDSIGIHWSLVELQSPEPKALFTRGGRKSAQLDEGIEQIRSWREWLRENGGVARRPILDEGHGFVGLSERAGGLVLIGRNESWSDHDRRRIESLSYDHRIVFHPYDWLIERAIHQRNHRIGRLEDGLWTMFRQTRGSFPCSDCDPLGEYAVPRPRLFTVARFKTIVRTGSVAL